MIRSSLLVTLLLLSLPSHAHKLHLFAFAEGERIQGSVYFAGAIPATAATLSITGQNGIALPPPDIDAEGEFVFTISQRQDYRISADTGDGHRAEWTLPASEQTQDLPVATGVTLAEPPPVSANQPPLPLNAQIERAVARQIRPLRQQLIAYEQKIRFQDVLGGLGYILGLMGLGLWWKSRGHQH